jgi:hypothetical protein
LALGACTDGSGYEIATAPVVQAPLAPVQHDWPLRSDALVIADTAVAQVEKVSLFAREPDTCHTADHTDLIGQTPAIVDAREWIRPIRIVSVGSIVTQEYVANRINFFLDTQGLIYKINCG